MRIVATLVLDLILRDDPHPEHPNLAVEFVLPFVLNAEYQTRFILGSWEIEIAAPRLQTSGALPDALVGRTLVALRKALARDPNKEFASEQSHELLSEALDHLNMLLRAWSLYQPSSTCRAVTLAELPLGALLELKSPRTHKSDS